MRKKNAGSTPAGSAPVSFRTSVASSMITMLLQSAYSVVDGLFVSNLVGDTALAAVNVAWPIIAVITAAGTGIGAGGASYIEHQAGRTEVGRVQPCQSQYDPCTFCGRRCDYRMLPSIFNAAVKADGAPPANAHRCGTVRQNHDCRRRPSRFYPADLRLY